MGELVARYALSQKQVREADAVPQSLLDELNAHQAAGRRVMHSVDADRGVLIYSVYEGDEPSMMGTKPYADAYIEPGHVELFVSLQASLLALGISSTSEDIAELRRAGALPFTKP